MQSNGALTELSPSLSPETQDYTGLWFVIRSHKWRIVAGLVLGLATAFAFHELTGPWHESSARLLVIKKQLDTAPISLPSNSGRVQEEYLPTHLMVFSSPKVVKQAVVKNNLQSLEGFQKQPNSAQQLIDSITHSLFGEKPKGAPEDGLTKSIIGSLVCEIPKPGVTPSHEILDVSYRSKNAEDCRAVLNAVIASYQDFLKDTYHDINAETLQMITKAREILQKDLDAREKAYLEFRQKTPLLWRGKDGNTVDQERLFNIDSRRGLFQMRQMEIKSSLTALEEGMKKGSSPAELLALLPGLPSNREIFAPTLLTPDLDPSTGGRTGRVSLEEQLILLQLQESRLLESYGPRHPDVQKIRRGIEDVQGLLTPSSKPLTKDRDKSIKDNDFIQIKIGLLKAELAVSERAEKSLTELFEHDQQAAKTATTNEITDETLRQGIERSKVLYESIVNRLKEITSVQEYGGYSTQVIAPPELGKLYVKKYALVVGLALFGGLLLGVGWSYLAHVSDKKFRTPQEIQQRLGLPVLGHIPRFHSNTNGFHHGANGFARKSILSNGSSPESPSAEAYRVVRTTAFFGSQANGRKIIQVTSPNLGDGKTTLAANLALSLAQVGKKVLLIDANLRQPHLHTHFGLPNQLGLSMLLAGEAEFASTIRHTGTPGLSIISGGPVSSNPGELLTSPRLKEILETARNQFDFVVLDTPALVNVIDSCVVAPQVDGVLLTLRIAKNGRPYAQQACERLKTMGANVFGVVVNQSSFDPGAGTYHN